MIIITLRGSGRRSPAGCILNRLHDHLGDNRKSHPCDLVLVTGGTVFTDLLDIKLQRRVTLRLDPFGPMAP
jgi:hypothetical protein